MRSSNQHGLWWWPARGRPNPVDSFWPVWRCRRVGLATDYKSGLANLGDAIVTENDRLPDLRPRRHQGAYRRQAMARGGRDGVREFLYRAKPRTKTVPLSPYAVSGDGRRPGRKRRLVDRVAAAEVTVKPATEEREGINPFTKELMTFKAKPASKVVRARPIKALKDAVA
jgi:hypothetical protein